MLADKWLAIKDGDRRALWLFNRHYSKYHYADGRKPNLFVGPGEKMVLLTADCLALFVWRKFIDTGQNEWMRNYASVAGQANVSGISGGTEPDRTGDSRTANNANLSKAEITTQRSQRPSKDARQNITCSTEKLSLSTRGLQRFENVKTPNGERGISTTLCQIENKVEGGHALIPFTCGNTTLRGENEMPCDCSFISGTDVQECRLGASQQLSGSTCSQKRNTNVLSAMQGTTSLSTTLPLLPEAALIQSRMPRSSVVVAMPERVQGSNGPGICCAVFRNEGPYLSSELILEAEQRAWERWPGERLYTYVKASAIQSANPGYCFKVAGWRHCGKTKVNKLDILEKLNDEVVSI